MRLFIMMPLLLLAACDSSEENALNGLQDADISNLDQSLQSNINVEVMRTRRVQGAWTGKIGKDQFELALGGDGTASMQITGRLGVTAMGQGTYKWTPQNTIEGTMTGDEPLSDFSTWRMGFTNERTAKITGDSNSIDVARR